MKWKTDKESILPVMQNDPDVPLEGMFAVSFGKGWPQRALRVQCQAGQWEVALDGLAVGNSEDWRTAFRRVSNGRAMLLGRRIAEEEYDRLVKARRADILLGINLEGPININNGLPPF